MIPITPAAPTPSLVTTPTAVETPAAFVADPAKTAEENSTAQAAFDTASKEALTKAEEVKAAEAKTAVEKEAAAKANDTKLNPFKLEEIKVPEGMVIDETVTKPFVELINKYGISREASAELVNLQASVMKTASEKGSADWNTLQETWKAQITADTSIGGEKLAPALGLISKAIDKFGSPETRLAFDLTGAGNNPDIIKFMHKMASNFSEGTFAPAGVPAAKPVDAASIMFPNQS